jgi:purine-binding chemotaxis protein CheW
LAGKYLTFNLGDEEYGLEILKVQEIIGMQEITKVPRSPEYVKGVINLRGKVIPVIDLRLKFGMEEKQYTRKTCIIVVQVKREAGDLIMGIIVDEVSEVLDISGDKIEAPPPMGVKVDTQFIMGMAKTDSSVKILLHIEQVLSQGELAAVKQTD